MKREETFSGLSRREFLYLSRLGMAGMSLGGIPKLGHAEDKKPKYGGRLRIGDRIGSTGVDPHKHQDFSDYLKYCLIYGALTEQGKLPEVEIYPMLAKSWEISKDGKEYIFPLREGVKFHNGKEFDSGDVKYSIERIMNPATAAPRAFAFKWVDSVHILDKFHIKIKLKAPFAPFLSSLTLYNCPIIPAGWEPSGMKMPPGTGPYMVKAFVPNETTEYTRFDQYWEVDEKTGNRLPYIKDIYVKKIVDDTVRLAALRAGDIDIAVGPPLNALAKAVLEKPFPGIIMDDEPIGNNLIWFNVSKPPFDNKKVRQALAYALNKKEILKAVFWGLGETINNQPFSNGSRFYIPVKDRETDLAKAKQLLAEAGYPKGFKMEFLEYSVNYYMAGAEVSIGQLQNLGVEAQMKAIDRAPYASMMKSGDYAISLGNIEEKFDWDDAFYLHFHSSEIGKNNFCRYSNPELDALLEKGRTTWKWEDRVPLYKRVIEILAEDVPVFFLYKPVQGSALRDYVKGYRKGFAFRLAWHGGGLKYWWIDK